ncbi:MAG TPA: ABC transporter permease [Mycobacteriales bacterium]|nr:ABC transporter permease [Mycobacteriales bacterium]
MRTRPPLALVLPAALAALLVLLPLAGLLTRTPWARILELLGKEQVRQALWLSVRCALSATLLALLLGVPLAWVLARLPFPGRRLLRGLVTVPLVLPPVVGGVALLLAFGRRGVLGPLLEDAGAVPAFTTYGVVLAETFVAMPFLVLTVEGALRSLPTTPEDVASSLGAGPLRVFRTVTLPSVLPALAAGTALTSARALGEFGATITFAGSYPGRTQTVPIAIYALLQDDPPAAYALSAVLLLVSVSIILGLRGRLR